VKYPGEKYHKDFLGKRRFRKQIDDMKRDALLRKLLQFWHLAKDIQREYQELNESPCPAPLHFQTISEVTQEMYEQEQAKMPGWNPFRKAQPNE
jgi:hypothetical protein